MEWNGDARAFPFIFGMQILEDELPLFPLHTVLFPHARMPLHIFEPRYREMIERCLRENLAFGIVRIKEGVEVGGDVTPSAVGTLAHIIAIDRLPDGQSNIVVKGLARFKLVSFAATRAYLTGQIQVLPDETVDQTRIEWLRVAAARLFETYIRAVQAISEQDASDPSAELQLPDDATVLSYLIASILPINLADKQSLLEMSQTAARLQSEIPLIHREQTLLRLVSTPSDAIRDQGSFSLN